MSRLTLLMLACAATATVLAPTPAHARDITPQDVQDVTLLLSNITGAFAVFKELFHKSYPSGEERQRYLNFASNLMTAATSQAQNPLAKFGVTPFSDLSESEFARTYLTTIPQFTQEDAEKLCNNSDPEKCDASIRPLRRGFAAKSAEDAHRVAYDELPEQFRRRKAYRDFGKPLSAAVEANAPPEAVNRAFAEADDSIPPVVDWRTKGVVSPVRYQGECGSCWSFVITGNIESLWAIAGNAIPDLSEQQLLSCVWMNQACEGGMMQYAYDWIVSNNNGYIAGEEYYPYVSADGTHVPACNNDGAGAAAHINRYASISRLEVEMQKYVANVGPISVAIEAHGWQNYNGGILSTCNNLMTTHAVVIVGYDVKNNPPYWIIKNSWSTNWGENGYMRIEMWKNVCKIADNPSTGLITGELSEALPTGDPARRVKNTASGFLSVNRVLAMVSTMIAAGVAMVL